MGVFPFLINSCVQPKDINIFFRQDKQSLVLRPGTVFVFSLSAGTCAVLYKINGPFCEHILLVSCARSVLLLCQTTSSLFNLVTNLFNMYVTYVTFVVKIYNIHGENHIFTPQNLLSTTCQGPSCRGSVPSKKAQIALSPATSTSHSMGTQWFPRWSALTHTFSSQNKNYVDVN